MVNGRSFVLSEQAISGMNAVQLYNKLVLSWYDGLSVTVSDNKKYVLIGECWSIKEDEDPARIIAETLDLNAKMILERENYWCGRYVLILEDRVYMDAAGTMSIFYHEELLSNSLNLLRELLGYELKHEKLFDGLSPDFVPGTKTQYSGVRRLLPSQVYDCSSKTVSSRALLPEFPVEYRSVEERISDFVEEFAQGLKNLDKHFAGKTKLITCTGGRDSRTVLAVSKFAGLDFGTTTLEHDTISNSDVNIPSRLSSALGRNHYYIKRDKKQLQRSRFDDFDRHICHYEKGADRDFYGYGQFEKLKEEVGNDIVLLRGSVWGIAIEYYAKEIAALSYDSLLELFPLIRYNPLYQASVNEWLDYAVHDTKNSLINPADRVFWELREGCWLSTIEGTFDIYEGITSVQPINCRRLISLLLGFDVDDRIEKLHEEKITSFAAPQLSGIPYDYQLNNSGISRSRRIAGYFQKTIWLLRNFGPDGLLRSIKDKFGGS